ncbi:hypothetical protein [Burkholderia cepacia]|uniref:hypothetical protein n=1 Tax=Burkholderia cepacia TaxID=292 RepID=UPI00398EB409
MGDLTRQSVDLCRLNDHRFTFVPSLGPRPMRKIINLALIRVRGAPHVRLVAFSLDAQVHTVGTPAPGEKAVLDASMHLQSIDVIFYDGERGFPDRCIGSADYSRFCILSM